MIVVKSSDVKAIESTGDLVAKGTVYRQLLIDEKMAGGLQVAVVSFSPGARLNFHTHELEQVLYVTDGAGIVATEEEEYIVTPGTVILIPPGEVHWHGATEDTPFSHVTIFRGDAKVD